MLSKSNPMNGNTPAFHPSDQSRYHFRIPRKDRRKPISMPLFQRSVDITDLTTTRFRKWAPFSGSKEIPTGYPSDRKWKKARSENEANCILYRIPREMLIEIMIQLGPGGIFIVRQTCSLMLNIFNSGQFRKCHKQTMLELDPEAFAPTLSKFLTEYLSFFNLPPPQPHFVPPVEFGTMQLEEEDIAEIRSVFRTQVLCARCCDRLASSPKEGLPPSEKETLDGLTTRFYCWGCQKTHPRKWFWENKFIAGYMYPFCIGWKGRMRLCPHQTFSREKLLRFMRPKLKERTLQFRCTECRPSFRRHGKLPTVTYIPSEGLKDGIFTGSHLETSWELPICHLLPGQALTKDMLRNKLSGAIAANSGLICEHMAHGDGYRLLGVFSWDRCTCFREPSAGAARCYAHMLKPGALPCCACNASQLDPKDAAARVGKFAATVGESDHATHMIRCHECHRQYSWRAEGRRVFLGMHFTMGRIKFFKQLTNVRCRMARVRVDREWLSRMDTKTYARAQPLKHIAWCDDPKCMNSSRLSGFWFWPEWNR